MNLLALYIIAAIITGIQFLVIFSRQCQRLLDPNDEEYDEVMATSVDQHPHAHALGLSFVTLTCCIFIGALWPVVAVVAIRRRIRTYLIERRVTRNVSNLLNETLDSGVVLTGIKVKRVRPKDMDPSSMPEVTVEYEDEEE